MRDRTHTDTSHMTPEEANAYANEVAAQGTGKYWRSGDTRVVRAEQQAGVHGREKRGEGWDELPVPADDY